MAVDRKTLLLYAVTDRGALRGRPLKKAVEDAIIGGATLVQLREKELSEDEFIAEALEIKAVCHARGVPLIINDSLSVALRSGADGVHVGLEDAPVAEIRRAAGPDFIIGATAKTVGQALAAQEAGADYLGVGAVFPSPTKENAVRITTEELRDICAAVSVPAVAIGGVTAGSMDALRDTGIAGVAVVSALFAAEDIKAAAAELRRKAEEIVC
ncbi:MAG: thiamine phosphate synthase [Oscillospiraceae bacterium]|nr:thiamine phosphate synthase [Oscillospiraceae bacterium]